jgi:LuxR family maltose regulon positive regulatory protein
VQRPGLVNRLRAATAFDVVLIAAPPGYGKTSLLDDWAARDRRPFARLSILRGDDATTLAARLEAAVGDALSGTPGPPTISPVSPEHAVVQVTERLSREAPLVIACDDVDRLRDPNAVRLLTRLADELQTHSQLALVGRTYGAFPTAKWRVADRLFELTTADLRFRDREAASLLRRAGTLLTGYQIETLNRGIEGWPAGLGFAAQSLQSSSTTSDGDDATLDYLRRVLLARMSERELRFLTRASVLHRLSSQLCDAVVGMRRSEKMLARLERQNLFVTPIGRDRSWYRLHPAFRKVLAQELEEREPGRSTELHRRAAAWCKEHGETELALEHAAAAEDVDQLADLIEHRPLPVLVGAHPAAVERWLSPIDDALLESRPAVAAAGAVAWGWTGRADLANRWAGIADSTGLLPVSLKALASPRNAGELREAADCALAAVPPGNAWRPSLLLLVGVACVVEGDESADRVLEEAGDAAAAAGCKTVESVALARRCNLATDAGDWSRADAFAAAAVERIRSAGLEEHGVTVLTRSASARTALRHGDWQTVHADLEQAHSLLPRLTSALPVFAVLVRAEMAQVELALGEAAGAQRLLNEIDEIYALQPRLGLFREDVSLLRAQLGHVQTRAAVLTAAELRLLPLLTTHLSFREIAERLFVSRNTVKTQAISVYRKLGVSSRGEAIDCAAGLGLVPGGSHARCA